MITHGRSPSPNAPGRSRSTPSLRLFIAEEQSAVGHVTEALGAADLCVREAEATPNIANHDAIITSCRALQSTLRTHIGQIIVNPPPHAPPGLHITVASNELNSAFFGVPYSVTPGDVHVIADAPGYTHFDRVVRVALGASASVDVELTALPQTASATPADRSGPPANDVAASPGLPVGGIVVAGVGVAALAAAAGVFWGVREPARALIEGACPDPTSCADTPANHSNASAAQSGAIATDVLLGVGGAAVIGGVLWLVLGRGSNHASTRAWLVPAPGGLSVGFGGVL